MRKTILMLLAVTLSGVATAWGQISFYGEWCYLNGELISKVWVSPKGLRSESIDKKTGEKFVTIIHQDTKKAYALFEDKKTGMMLEPTKMTTNRMVGLDVVSHEQNHAKYLGEEEVDGRICKKYVHYSTHINNLNGEEVTEGGTITWIYEPMRASNYSGCVAEKIGGQYDRLQVLRNIRQGPQPDRLFEIPADYKLIELPEGGLMEMFTGKPREQNQKDANEVKQNVQEGLEKIKKAADKNKSQDEQIKDMLKLFEDMQKKK